MTQEEHLQKVLDQVSARGGDTVAVEPKRPCMVNHERETDLFFAILERQAETRKMLQRAVAFVKTATSETPYWGEAEEFVTEAEAFLASIGFEEAKELQPGEEPF